jgi:hypothetical protein
MVFIWQVDNTYFDQFWTSDKKFPHLHQRVQLVYWNAYWVDLEQAKSWTFDQPYKLVHE